MIITPSNTNRHQLITNKTEDENSPTTTSPPPLFCQSVKTKIGTKFIELINKHFGPNHPYRKIFSRKTLKISYCCTPNTKAIIKKLLNTNIDPTILLQCRIAVYRFYKYKLQKAIIQTQKIIPGQHQTH